MGLTNQSTGIGILDNELLIEKSNPNDKVIALGGNPNVGKSTVFNNLTGLNQHTGNWPGKTVTNAQGKYTFNDNNFILVDIPGTYSLMANSIEEQIARDFICFGNPDTTVIVVDATCLERNLNLVLQTLEITSNVVVCVNLMDEAKRKHIEINLDELSIQLGVPVMGTSANVGLGMNELMSQIANTSSGNIMTEPLRIKYNDLIEKLISKIEDTIKESLDNKINPRWVALKLLEGEKTILESIDKYLGYNLTEESKLIDRLEEIKKSYYPWALPQISLGIWLLHNL